VPNGIAQMRAALEGLGHDPTGLQVVGTLRTVKDEHGRPDIVRTMHGVPALVEAGVTDVRTHFPVPTDVSAAGEVFEQLATEFRAVTR